MALRRPNVKTWQWILLGLFLLVFGIGAFVHNVYLLPRKYAHLRDRGVPATAVFAGWRGLGHDRAPWVTLRYREHQRTWRYPNDQHQFAGLPTGAPVAMVVDPRAWKVAYTTRDVERSTNAGWSVPAFFGLGIGLFGVAVLVMSERDRRRIRRLTYR